jgi:hypothetical protein
MPEICARENGQIGPIVQHSSRRRDGSRRHLASVLKQCRKNVNIQPSLGVIWGIPGKVPELEIQYGR